MRSSLEAVGQRVVGPGGMIGAGPRRIAIAAGALGLGLLEPAVAQLTFIDQAPATTIAAPQWGRGSAMVDLDLDGRLDILAGNAGMPNSYYWQQPNGTFKLRNQAWQIPEETDATWGVLVADFDNDGDPDVFALNGGFTGEQPNRVLRNDLPTLGLFTDVTADAGDAAGMSSNFGGTALDYDRDGDLDVFLTTTYPQTACQLLRNDGNLVFTDVSATAGIVEIGNYRHCSTGDFDNDGWPDVGVAHTSGANRLYRNQANGTFVDVAAAANAATPTKNFGFQFDDFDNDGWLDVYVAKFQGDVTGPSLLLRNMGDGTFADVTPGSGMTGQPDMGHNTGDLDGDGYPDIFIGTGSPDQPFLDLLFTVRPDGEGGFTATDVSETSGILANGPTRCHGMAIGDYNEDGVVDVYANNGGPEDVIETIETSFLWEGQSCGRGWTAVRLTGVASNWSAVGARCVALTSTGREIHRVVRVGQGFANTCSPIQHFGLEIGETVERIDVWWPSAAEQVILDPPLSTIIDVVEEPPCLADLDGDGTVAFGDLVALLASWGPCSPGCSADLDWNGLIGFGDLLRLVSSWGPCG